MVFHSLLNNFPLLFRASSCANDLSSHWNFALKKNTLWGYALCLVYFNWGQWAPCEYYDPCESRIIVAIKIIPGHLRRCSDPVGHFLFWSVAIIYEKTNRPNAGSLNFRSDQGDRDNDRLESNLYCAHILCIAGRTCQRVFQCDFIQTNVPLRLVVARVFCSSLPESGDLISVNPYGLKKLYTILIYYNVKCSIPRSKASVFFNSSLKR